MMRALGMAAVLTWMLMGAAAAQDLASARTFLNRVYAPYVASSRKNVHIDWTKWADPSLVSLLRRSQELTPRDEVPSLNGDPICGCQDWVIPAVAVTTKPGRDGEVLGTASFSNQGTRKTVRHRLVRAGGTWRIADIMDADTPSLRAFLEKDIADREKDIAR